MFLCDQLGRVATFRNRLDKLGVPRSVSVIPAIAMILDATAMIGAGIAGTTRFVLDDEVISAACQVLLSRPSSVRDCLAVMRVPWRSAWIEWREGARLQTRRELGISHENGRETPGRFGFLIQASEDGRSGSVRFGWSHAVSGQKPSMESMPSVSPFNVHFDLSRIASLEDFGAVDPEVRKASDLYRKWARSPAETAAIDDVNKACWYEGLEVANSIAASAVAGGGGEAQVKAVVETMLADIAGEALQVFSVLMMLTARNGVETNAGEGRAKLNKARAQRGESPLLEHIIVRMRLSRAETSAIGTSEFGGTRSSPRAHTVSGHFVRRGDAIYWRRPHARGLAGAKAAATKTVRVSL